MQKMTDFVGRSQRNPIRLAVKCLSWCIDERTSARSQLLLVVKMLAVVVVVFAVLWLPYRGLVVYNSFITLFGGEPYMDLWFLMFAKTCVYINRMALHKPTLVSND
ncbi:hypothetical protein GE061_020168 [Apolygus lucorum]|uniref:Thyrotropin-releasing hormone receptor n=1 Tax=Apolygus lucorum TaxID=248454 RepID=A0A8S9WMK4_APOLU|nr:hypothetical protein GE061_020168 [Apolygus lucorum]